MLFTSGTWTSCTIYSFSILQLEKCPTKILHSSMVVVPEVQEMG